MVSATPAARRLESTAASLQQDLARLKLQKEALGRELAAVEAHLGSVQRALDALGPLLSDADAEASGESRAEPETAAETQAGAPARPVGKSGARAAGTGRRAGGAQAARRTGDATVDGDGDGDDDGRRAYGRLTEQILAHLAGAGDADVRARDVAAALGRDTDSGSINAVRSTLDRLVAAHRVRRTGRGRYRAPLPGHDA
ncbi:hypothetical protein [Streptomyces fuscigenes]|uniref:hypothetical protein n=1 Tax=Streptomyces fuscigenes TaxID=1528880 RepID=UPI001F402E6C|nr:hypothetical protein [Streptomyces fuscigenes]MCF3962703.1 hypothetical protein [Streptomyces fuscigenes]